MYFLSNCVWLCHLCHSFPSFSWICSHGLEIRGTVPFTNYECLSTLYYLFLHQFAYRFFVWLYFFKLERWVDNPMRSLPPTWPKHFISMKNKKQNSHTFLFLINHPVSFSTFYWLNSVIYKWALKKLEKHSYIQKENTLQREKGKYFLKDWRYYFNQSLFWFLLYSCLFYIKMYQFCFSSHINFW